MKSTFEKMGGTYTLGADGIYYPNLVSTDEEPHYGKYGMILPEEVLEEVVQHVAMSVELQETLRVLRFCGGALGCAVRVQPGYHADLACLLVTDYQHVLFVFFLCHLKNVLMGYL